MEKNNCSFYDIFVKIFIMANEDNQSKSRFSAFRNWISMSGVAIMVGGLFAFVLFFIIDLFTHYPNPYLGVLIYLVCPILCVIGAIVAVIGAFLEHRRI
ncbi:MAG TPA: hypothetical protein PLW02_10535, partial [Verrucomicrobiota bacterium]|nr:hypothetical protein [Verrucomicrobiota bacterium]